MAIPIEQDITIYKGATFQMVLRWDTGVPTFKAVSGITKAAPAVITCTGHGVPEGWPVAIVSAQGMTEINEDDIEDRDNFTPASISDADTISLPFVNSSEYTTYTSGGYVAYYTPHSLAAFIARMQIRPSYGADEATVSLVSPTNIALDDTVKTITVTIADSVTEDLSITNGVYDLELEDNTGVVYQLARGEAFIEDEATQ